jgi:hypothetical protein
MLPPVSVVSSVGAAASKPAVAATATSVALANAANPAVVLSNAANASVEGKLSIMLAAVRDRMVQSLLDIMNAVSDTLDMPQEADEDNVSHVLRIADAVQDLTPKQLATVQQQLQGANQALPLQLIAQALKNPAGPAAAQVVAYLETARYTGRDLVTEAVIDSYSENEATGEPTAPASPTFAAAVAADEPELPLPVPQAASPQQANQASQTNQAPPAALAADARSAPPAATVTQQAAGAPTFAVAAVEDAATSEKADSAAVGPLAALASLAEALEVAVDQKSADVPNPQVISAAVPIALKEIAADVQEGLQIAIHFAIEAAGPEIVNMMAEGEQVADAVIANALVADVLDAAELQQQDAAAPVEEPPAPATAVHVQAEAAETSNDAVPLSVGLTRLVSDSSALASSNLTAAAAAMAIPTPPPPVAGIGYVIAQYPPADDPIEENREASVDRVDAVGDEPEGGSRGGQWQQKDDGEAGEQEQSLDGESATAATAAGRSEPAAPDMPAPANAASEDKVSPAPAALPAPGTIALQLEAYDFYQRMAAE